LLEFRNMKGTEQGFARIFPRPQLGRNCCFLEILGGFLDRATLTLS
jgi:hypothetical protein